jgi:hypothetical protein
MAPVTILIVDKIGSVKETTVKFYDENELYKKAGFKTSEDFKLRANWNIENGDSSYCLYVFGKITGRANQENKYDFPPPIDSTLMFGNCIIVNKNKNNEVVSITEEEWDTAYEFLFGGFHDIEDKDSVDEEDEEDDDEDGIPRTKEGYIKDGFIVDDDEEEEEDDDEEEEEEEDDDEEEDFKHKTKKIKIKSQPKAKPTDKKKKVKEQETIFNKLTETTENYLDCTSELNEEDYV